MAWAEMHVLVGIGIYAATDGNVPLAAPLAIASHWPLDDLNVGRVARMYHGIGRGWIGVLTTLLRLPLAGFILWVFWQEPMVMLVALPAWLLLDHEWALVPFGRHGYGLHQRMWPAWLHSEWGMIPKFVALGLLVAVALEGLP